MRMVLTPHMRTTTKFWLTSSSTNPHIHLLLTHHFLGVDTIGSAWLMFISRTDMFCFWTCPMCVHCSFETYILESHLAMIQTPQYITFLSKNLNTHRTWCIIMCGKKAMKFRNTYKCAIVKSTEQWYWMVIRAVNKCMRRHSSWLGVITSCFSNNKSPNFNLFLTISSIFRAADFSLWLSDWLFVWHKLCKVNIAAHAPIL